MENTFKWSDDYLMGYDVVDNEHKYLFHLANTVMAIKNPSQARAELKKIMFELYEYVQLHFEHEEAFMKKIRYPGLQQHHEIHLHIIEMLSEMLEVSKDLEALSSKLQSFIKTWIIEHVQQKDMKIKDWKLSQ